MSLSVDIKKRFEGFDLEMAFEAGDETLGLLGESGCGKSVTMRSIAGIETPDEGKIVVNDVVFFDKAAGKKPQINLTPQQRKTALLFQNYQLFPNMTVEQNVAAGIGKDIDEARAQEIVEHELKRFSLEHFNKRYPLQLSGGQQQRVALARMLAANPGILMLDEPFSALDSHLKSILEQNLVSLFEAFAGTILYVSHDIDEALRFCDRIAVVDNGHIMELDTGDELFNNPKSEAAIKLSGCKNITEAQRKDEHRVYLPRWGITVETTREVPVDIKQFGVRAFFLEQVAGPGTNNYRARVDRVSDSRFDSTVLLQFLDSDTVQTDNADDAVDEMRYLHNHAFWRIDKLNKDYVASPSVGDVVWIHIPPEQAYLVTC